MATVVLTAVGSALGPAGAALGGALGSYIDQKYLFPAILGPAKVVGQKVGDLQLTGAVEGTPIPRVYGTKRITGHVMWKEPKLRNVPNTKKVSQGKGGDVVITEFIPTINFAISWCRAPSAGISNIKKIWANGKVIYEDVVISIVDAGVSIDSIRRTFNWSFGVGAWTAKFTAFPRVKSPSGGIDLTQFLPGMLVTMSGWTNGGNNGQFIVTKSWKRTNGITYMELTDPNNVTVLETAGASVTFAFTGQKFDATKVAAVTNFMGTTTQVASTLIEATEGSGNVSGYRGRAYTAFTDFELQDFGNTIPQLIEAEIEEVATRTLADAIGNILEEVGGLTSGEYDVSAVTGNLAGYHTPGFTTTEDALEPLMVAFNLTAQDVGSKLVFKPRNAVDEITVLAADLGAHVEGQETDEPFLVERVADIRLPSEVVVEFMNSDNDYMVGTRRHRRTGNLAEGVLTINLSSVVMTADAGLILAKQWMWTLYTNRNTVNFTLPPSYFHTAEQDIVNLPDSKGTHRVLVKEITEGANGILEGSGTLEHQHTQDFT